MIHPTAIIEDGAVLADDVKVGPFSYIGAGVEIGAGCQIESHVVVKGPSKIGKNNRIFQFASIGEDCQDKKYAGEPTTLQIGDNNVFREGCTVHRGTTQDIGTTIIGSNNLCMAYVHVAHDCVVGDNNIFANNAAIAGHVHIGNDVILGGYSGVHQFCRIGSNAMTRMGSMVVMDVPAYVMVGGNPAKASGMNFEGMKRRQFPEEVIKTLRKAYKAVYRQGLTIEQAVQEIESWSVKHERIDAFVESLKAATRGITR